MTDVTGRLDAIQAQLNAATPGPWGWFGNTDTRSICLATKDRGRQFIMTFQRWGMQGAQPWFNTNMWMAPASERARYEVCPDAQSRDDRRVYRADISGINHPDAEFIASSPENTRFLLDLARKQQAAIDAVTQIHQRAHKEVEPWARGYRYSGDHCADDGEAWPCPTIQALGR